MPPARSYSSRSQQRRRLPVSCEPCRLRKIRCPRDGTPCATCVRRRVRANCQYASNFDAFVQDAATSSGAIGTAPGYPVSATSNRDCLPVGNSETNDLDLARRVQELERVLQLQAKSSMHSSSSMPPTQPAQKQGGVLQTSASGHVRYIPTGNGLDGLIDEENDTAFLNRLHAASPLGDLETKRTAGLLYNLPPTRHCTELVDIYFSSFASLFHILHDPTFRSQYQSFVKDPESMPLAWLALLFAILATAVLALDSESTTLHDLSRRTTIQEKVADLSQRYRRAAFQCLDADSYLWNHNVTTLQALLLIIYGISHSHGQSWTLLGLAQNVATSIGCHIDPAEFNVDATECEERRRCWAVLMMLYTSQNTSMGHIGPARIFQEASSRLPADVDDDRVGHWAQPLVAPSATQMSYLLFKFRLYNICSDICEHVLRPRQLRLDVYQELDDRIEDEMRDWKTRYSSPSTPAQLPLHHQAHLHVLESYASHISLLLHQSPASDPSSAIQAWSAKKCFECAMRILETHAFVEESLELAPFRWYNRGIGSFHALHSATVLLKLKYVFAQSGDITAIDQALEDCAVRFQRMSDLSPFCSRAASFLQQLLACQSSQMRRQPAGRSTPGLPLPDEQEAQDLHMMLATPSDSQNTEQMNDANLEDLLQQFQPEQWLAPAALPWEQWNAILNGISVDFITT